MWATVVAVAIAWTASEGTPHVRLVFGVSRSTASQGAHAAQPQNALRSEEERAARLIEDARRELISERYDQAIELFSEARTLVFPDGPYALRRDVLRGLGAAHGESGRYDRALELFASLDNLAREHRDTATEAIAKYNAITARRKQMEELPDFEQRPLLISAARGLVAVANESRDSAHRARAHRTLADLIAPDPETRAEAARHYQLALEAARLGTDRSELATCLWVLGRFYAGDRPAESHRLIDEALQEALASGRPTAVAYAWRQRLRLAWQTQPAHEAAAISRQALQAIEALRHSQSLESSRASAFAAWTLDYHWLIGTLLESPAPDRGRISLAFEVSERMRARALLENLDTRAASSSPEVPELTARRTKLLAAITSLQRRLLNPALGSKDREPLILEIEGLERQEATARAALQTLGDVPAREATFHPLDRIEQELAPDQAMLSFSVGLARNFYEEFGGGASILVITRTGTTVVRIPDRLRLRPALSAFRGVIEHSDEVDPRSSVALYEMILQDAVAALPPTVTRLVVVPDGPLHHLPFAALTPSTSSPALGATHEITVIPSATVWLRLRQATHDGRGDALVFADPGPPSTERESDRAMRGGWLPLSELRPLPFSQREGRAVVRHVGGGSRLLMGAEATESALKAARLTRTGVLHFATHALVDEHQPDRSAVVLAADADHDDGLLQAREIADLRLPSRLVVLSACRSATGAVLSGEGVMGLSRAFFEAGASAVIGTLWEIRDDHAATFFDGFYASLKTGQTVGTALLEARRRAIAAGVPARAWASVVVIGDDTIAPLSPSTDSSPWLFATAGTVALSLILMGVVGTRWRRRVRQS